MPHHTITVTDPTNHTLPLTLAYLYCILNDWMTRCSCTVYCVPIPNFPSAAHHILTCRHRMCHS